MSNISEVVLLTKSLYLQDFIEWINYYIKLGFDHITVYDNESPVNIKSICKKYSNVTYNYVSGWPNQCELYLTHYKLSKFSYVYFADDDEFLWINPDKYKNINEFITTAITPKAILAIFWQKMSSNPVIFNRKDIKSQTQIKAFQYRQYIEDESWCKCFYPIKNKNIDKIYCHIPNFYTNKIVDINGINIMDKNPVNNEQCICKRLNYNVTKDDAIIFHYYHKSWQEYYKKMRSKRADRQTSNKDEFPDQQWENIENYINLLYTIDYSFKDTRVQDFLYG